MKYLRNGFYLGILLLMGLATGCQMGTSTPIVVLVPTSLAPITPIVNSAATITARTAPPTALPDASTPSGHDCNYDPTIGSGTPGPWTPDKVISSCANNPL